ncbi:hypothetical protein GF415_00080 [Candidatus Micrarchaeota archaeon]|nr:hypothetical protein [Candidatus Micrarchaeota archaeon]
MNQGRYPPMPGKYPTVGFETEFFTINEKGALVNEADWLMALLKTKRRVHSHLREEVFHSMLEIGAHPGRSMKGVWIRYLENLRKVIEAGKEDGIRLLALSTYPGKSRPTMRKRAWYSAQSSFLGGAAFFQGHPRLCIPFTLFFAQRGNREKYPADTQTPLFKGKGHIPQSI